MKKIFLSAFPIFLITLLLNIRTDGFFPLSAKTSEVLNYSYSLIILFLIVILIFISFKAKQNLENVKSASLLLIVITSINIIIYSILTIRNQNNNPSINSLNISILVLVGSISFFIVAISIFKKSPKATILSIFLSTTLLSIIQILYFPITAKIGDLMPIIIEQGRAFLQGENIYQFYLLDNGVLTQAVRQPGNVLAFLPSIILNIDPRILSIFYTVGGGYFLLKIRHNDLRRLEFDLRFLNTIILIAIFLLFPYRLVRMDLYEPPFWFLFIVLIYFLKSRKYLISSIIFGFGIFTQVWFWIFTPFFTLYIYKNNRLKNSLKYISISLLIGFGLLAIFILRDPSAYYYHIFGYYREVLGSEIIYWNNYYLTPLLHLVGIGNINQIIQVVGVGILGGLSIKFMKNLKTFLAFISLAFLFFIQFNSLTWNYFYINLVLFLVTLTLVSEDKET